MRETGFFTGLCCWTGAADGGNRAQPVQQAQSASGGEVTGASADSEPLLPSRSQAELSVSDSSATGLSSHRKTAVGLKGILKKSCEILPCTESSDQEPGQAESVDADGCGNKKVSFEPMMTVYRIAPRNASMKMKQISSHTRAHRQMLESAAREEQTSEAKINTRKNSAINERGEKLRSWLRSKAAVRAGVVPGRP